MSSAVDIANQALLMLGARPIVSFEDDTTEANALKVLYPASKGQVLRAYPWRCATKTATLATLADPPVNTEWTHAQAVPEDSIRIIRVIEAAYPNNPSPDWTVEGRTVLTKIANVVCEYIYDVPEPQMDFHVQMALAAKVAVDLSYTLTASGPRESQLAQMFEAKLEEARTTDRQEASHKTFTIDQLTTVR
jgi:hypothetical protein